MELDQAIID